MLHLRDVNALTEVDVQRFVDDAVPEGRDLDYKEHLPKDTEDDRREFRFDVSSFANAGGGLIVFGIKEKKGPDGPTGIPEKLVPLSTNPDKETLRLEQILRAHVDPRIPGVQVRFIQINSGHICVVRIPKSWLGLHLVKHNDSYRFYSRTSKGKYILDVTEIRTGFVAAQEGYERLRRFRHDRLAKIIANEGPVPLEDGPKVVLHVLPISTVDPTIEFDLSPVQEGLAFPPQLGGNVGWSNQHNYDGFIKSVRLAQEQTSNYLQFFRNGTVEEVLGRIQGSQGKTIRSVWVESSCIRSLTNSMAALKRLGVVPPFLVCISLLGIHGYTWAVDFFRWHMETTRTFRESDFILPEVLVSTFDQLPQATLRPQLDRIWNAAGHEKSPYFDEAGHWIGASRG